MIRLNKTPFIVASDKGKGETFESPKVIRVNNFTTAAVNLFRKQMEHALNFQQSIIPVVIDSYGGGVYALLAMVDILEKAKKVACIPTIVEGKAMSCGAILYSCGTEGYRYCAPNATVMIHDVSSMSFGKSGDLEADAAEVKRLNRLLYRKMADNTGNEQDYFFDLVQSRGRADWFLTPRETKKHKLSNKLHLPELQIDVRCDLKII